jgi:hypothetical protein
MPHSSKSTKALALVPVCMVIGLAAVSGPADFPQVGDIA